MMEGGGDEIGGGEGEANGETFLQGFARDLLAEMLCSDD